MITEFSDHYDLESKVKVNHAFYLSNNFYREPFLYFLMFYTMVAHSVRWQWSFQITDMTLESKVKVK